VRAGAISQEALVTTADREWFERMVAELLPDLFGTALRLTRNRADAEHLVADTVARAWSHLPELTDRTRLRGWLFRILTNSFLSARRTDKRRSQHRQVRGRLARCLRSGSIDLRAIG
jgi:DNA-directed RNA polymerase specialized sigma24 family protein